MTCREAQHVSECRSVGISMSSSYAAKIRVSASIPESRLGCRLVLGDSATAKNHDGDSLMVSSQ